MEMHRLKIQINIYWLGAFIRYNKQLDTFIQVADSGSFSKAVQALYIYLYPKGIYL